MPRTSRVSAITAIAVALTVTLTGCTAPEPDAPASAPAVAPSPEPAPTSAAADPLDDVVALVLRPMTLDLQNEAGVAVRALGYLGDVPDAVATLTAVVGQEPAVQPYEGTMHTPPGVRYVWGDLVLEERRYDPVRRAEKGLDASLAWPSFAIYFDGPAAGDVVLRTTSGLQAGAAWADVEVDPGYADDVWTCNGTAVDVADVVDAARGQTRATVVASAADDGMTALWLGAPELEADGCA